MPSLALADVVGKTTDGGEVVAMWMPIAVSFSTTPEHPVLNVSLFPSALIMDDGFSVADDLIWTGIPTLAGDVVGGLALTGPILNSTRARTGAPRAGGRAAAPALRPAD